MTKITKESLEAKIKRLESLGNAEYGLGKTINEEYQLEAYRMLLASMGSAQEPVGFYRKGSDGYYFASPTEQRPGTIPLYAAPHQAPEVPGAISTREAIARMENHEPTDSINVAYKHGWNACRAAMLQSEHVNRDELLDGCSCHSCRPVTIYDMRMVVCPDCGNKRCPKANDHRNACTGSNEPGQDGSAYPAAPQQE